MLGLGLLSGATLTVIGQGPALAEEGALVVRGESCSVGGETTTNTFIVLTPSGSAQSSYHAGPNQTGPASSGGAVVFHDAGCYTAAGLQRQSIYVFMPSGGFNAVCLANPGI